MLPSADHDELRCHDYALSLSPLLTLYGLVPPSTHYTKRLSVQLLLQVGAEKAMCFGCVVSASRLAALCLNDELP